MHIGKKKILLLGMLIFLVNAFFVFATKEAYAQKIDFSFQYSSEESNMVQVFYSDSSDGFGEGKSIKYDKLTGPTKVTATIPTSTRWIRIDFADNVESDNVLKEFAFVKEGSKVTLSDLSKDIEMHEGELIKADTEMKISANGNDSFVVFSLDEAEIEECISLGDHTYTTTAIILCIGYDILCVILLLFVRKNEFTKDIIRNRKLIWNLSVNDFKTKFSGSFFGIFWAFVSPVVTILVYWFVFQVGLRSAPIGDIPFVLWLIAGIVPWFFFQEALTTGTNCLIDYSYLVKKVVFQINILPIVKIISSLFVHVFFICFALIVYACYGLLPNLYTLQIIYYLFAMVTFVLALSFLTCSLVVFFKDLGQIIQIFMQVGVWMTPILWNASMIPSGFEWVFKLNPMYYIVDGYRDALINHVWFWEKAGWTLGFWAFTLIIIYVGIKMFKKLKVHFADVL